MIINSKKAGITPTGNINITTTQQTDVTNYATAQVVDTDLIASNIKKDVNILGVVGSFEGGEAIFWNAYRGTQYTANVEIPNLVFTNAPNFREAHELISVSAPYLTNISAYFIYDSSVRRVYLPRATVLTNNRVLGHANQLQEIECGSVGYGITNVINTIFYGMGTVKFTGTFFTNGDYADTLLSTIRSSGAAKATIIIKASEDTTYGGVTYAAGETMITSEVA